MTREGRRILVIEDEEGIRERIVRMLTFEGYDVVGLADGRAGIEAAWDDRPDVIVCDLMMPGINGFGACRVLKEDDRTKAVPIIVLSALVAQIDREKAHALGVNAYVTKPFRNQTLLAAIESCLGGGASEGV